MSATVGQLSLAHVIYKCNSRSVMSATAGHILWHNILLTILESDCLRIKTFLVENCEA